MELTMRIFKKKSNAYSIDDGFHQATGLHYLDVLDAVEARVSPKLYLEIGSRTGTSLARRKCSFIGVDPTFKIEAPVYNSSRQMHFMQMTSDAFFESGFLSALNLRPDMAFIDGLHLFEFALRDFMNCERVMKGEGLVFFHDVLPFNAAMTSRTYAPGTPWTGDVWKTILAIVENRSDLRVDVISAAKTGLACVRGLKNDNAPWALTYEDLMSKYQSLDIATYGIENYLSKIKIVTPEHFLSSLS
jgi:hypothetical protein